MNVNKVESTIGRSKGRKRRGFIKSRYKAVAIARSNVTPHEPQLFDADKHLPQLPRGYAKYRESAAWKRAEADIRRQRVSMCEDCKRFTRCELFHTSARHILPHDPAFVVMLCNSCRDKRTPMRPPVVKIENFHEKNSVRQALRLPRLSLESKT